MRNFVVLKIGEKYNEHAEEYMFAHNSEKRTGRSRKASGTDSFARIKLCHESLESRRLLTGNDAWGVYVSPGEDISLPSDISSASLEDFLAAHGIFSREDFFSANGISLLEDFFAAHGIFSLEDFFSANDFSMGDESSTGNDFATGDDFSMGDESSTGNDFATGDDLATGDEFATGDDLATGDELATGDDLATGDELATGDDLATGDELATGDDLATGDGLKEPPYNDPFVGLSTKAAQQGVADSVANGIHSHLEALLSNQSPVPPELAPVPPSAVTWVGTVTNPAIDSFDIGQGVKPADATDCAIDVSGSGDPLVAIGFGEAVDDVTFAVNDYCSQQIMDLANTLELLPGQIIACIWFDPINFSVSIGGQEVSYDYDNNPTAIVGSIPGASLVVTPAGQSTPGGVQAIMFAGNSSTIDIQMNTTNSGELMRGGVNIFTVTTGSNGPTVQPTIRTVFQGYLQRDSIVMSFDPSQPSFVRAGVAAGSVSIASLSSAVRAVGSGAGGGLPIGIAGNFPGPDLLVFAFLDPTSLANSGLDISGSTAVSEDQEGEVDGLNEMLDQLGADDFDTDTADDDEDDVSGEDRDGPDAGEFETEEDDLPDEEQLDEAISVIFDLIGESLASSSGHVDVLKILKNDRESTPKKEQPDANRRHQHWETYSTEFLAKPIERLNRESLTRVESAGQSKSLDT